MIWTFTLVASSYSQDRSNPPTVMSYEFPTKAGLAYPAATICNWLLDNGVGPPLTLITCTHSKGTTFSNFNTTDCQYTTSFFNLTLSVEIEFDSSEFASSDSDVGGNGTETFTMQCLTINPGNTSYTSKSSNTLFNNLLATIEFSHPDGDNTQYFPVLLHDPNETPRFEDILGAPTFVFEGQIVYLTVSKSKETLVNSPTYSNWTSQTQSVNVPGTSFASFGMSYSTLTTQILQQQYGYGWDKAFADLSSYAGTIVDINLYKFVMCTQGYAMLGWIWFKMRRGGNLKGDV